MSEKIWYRGSFASDIEAWIYYVPTSCVWLTLHTLIILILNSVDLL